MISFINSLIMEHAYSQHVKLFMALVTSLQFEIGPCNEIQI